MNSSNLFKKIIIFSFMLFILAMIYFGSYRPWQKSMVPKLTEADFNSLIEKVDYFSPIGEGEVLAHYYLLFLIDFLDKVEISKEDVIFLMRDAEKRVKPYLVSSRGLGFHKNVFYLAIIYKITAQKINEPVYYQKSAALLERLLIYSPYRPYLFYELFEVYQKMPDLKKTKAIGEFIVNRWQDRDIAEKLQKIVF